MPVSPDPQGPVEIVVWSSRPLPETLKPAARELPGVLGVGALGRGILDLRAVAGAEASLPARPRDSVLPVNVSTIDPELAATFSEAAPIADVLAADEAVVPRESASFRRLEVGDHLVLRGNGRSARLRVGAVVEDARLFRSEVIISESLGASLGVDGSDVLVLAVSPEEAPGVEAELDRRLGDFPARVRSRSGSGASGSSRRLLSLLELKQAFGEFWYRGLSGGRVGIDPAWLEANIVRARVPVLGSVTCHERIIPQLTEALLEIEREGLGPLVDTYDGCFNPRMQVSDGTTLSRHAYGVAIDINAATNRYGGVPSMDPRIVGIMESWGFTWGGRWPVSDGMHFEFVRFPDD